MPHLLIELSALERRMLGLHTLEGPALQRAIRERLGLPPEAGGPKGAPPETAVADRPRGNRQRADDP